MATGITLYRNPEYAKQYPHWKRYSDLYYGDHDTVCYPEYLFYHKIETATADTDAARLRNARCQRTRFLKLPEIIVSLWQSLLFRSEPTLDNAALNNLDGAENNIDGQGTSFTSWLRDQACRDYLIFGKVIALTDAFPFTATSKADERAKGLRPYVELLSPLSVVDWALETADSKRIGLYNFLRHEYDVAMPRSSSNVIPTIRRQTNELAAIDGKYVCTVYNGPEYNAEVNGNVIGYGSNLSRGDIWQLASRTGTQLSEIPVSFINSVSWIDGVCEETLRHFNIRSNRDNILYNQGFDQVFIKGISAKDIPTFSNAMNEYSKIFLPENGDAFKLDAASVDAYERAEAQAIDNVFKVGLNQLSSLPSDSKLIQAADSILAQKDNMLAIVESSIEELETFANDILTKFGEFTGRAPGQIDFCKDITTQDINDFLAVWNSFRDELRNIPEVRRPALKRASEKLGLNDVELKEAHTAIDSSQPAQPISIAGQLGRRADLVSQALNGGQ